MIGGKITGLGPIRIFDKESGELMLEGQLTGYTFKDERGRGWQVKTEAPKICPHCGADLNNQTVK